MAGFSWWMTMFDPGSVLPSPRIAQVVLNDNGTRMLAGNEIVIDVGSRAAGLEALELDYLPSRLVVLGGGYVGVEMAQAFRRFGRRVTLVERGRQLMGREESRSTRAATNV